MAHGATFSIALLFDNPLNSIQIAQSLKDKELDVHVAHSAAELIQLIATQQLDLVGLSVNHASASSLVQVLKSRTQISILAFGEDNEMSTAKAVAKTGASFQITGAVTSYNIWLKIGHLVKEKQRQQERLARMNVRKDAMEEEDAGAMIIRSSKKKDMSNAAADEDGVHVRGVGSQARTASNARKTKEDAGKIQVVSSQPSKGEVGTAVSYSGSQEDEDTGSVLEFNEMDALAAALKNASEESEIEKSTKPTPKFTQAEPLSKNRKTKSEETELVYKESPSAKGESATGEASKKAKPKNNGGGLLGVRKPDDKKAHQKENDADAPEQDSQNQDNKIRFEKGKKGGGNVLQIDKRKKDNGSPTQIEKGAISTHSDIPEDDLIDDEIDQMQSLFFDTGADAGHGSVSSTASADNKKGNGGVIMQEGRAREKASATYEEGLGREKAPATYEQAQDQEGAELMFQQAQEEAKKKKHESSLVAKKKTAQETKPQDKEQEAAPAKVISLEQERQKKKKPSSKSTHDAPATIEPMEKLRYRKTFREAVATAGESDFTKQEGWSGFGLTTKVSIIPVDNPFQRGLLLVANSDNDYATAEEISGFKGALVNEMKQKKQTTFSLGETLNVETFEVDVCEWAARNSQFFYFFEGKGGKKILICFLQRDPIYPKTSKDDEQSMHRIDLYEVPPKMPVNFDAYLLLTRNEKMLPYVRRGGSLSAKQIERLYKRGFKFLYVKEEAVPDYHIFCLSLFLNQGFRLGRKLA